MEKKRRKRKKPIQKSNPKRNNNKNPLFLKTLPPNPIHLQKRIRKTTINHKTWTTQKINLNNQPIFP